MSRFSKQNATPAVWRILMAIEWAQMVNERSVSVDVADLKEFLAEADNEEELELEVERLQDDVNSLGYDLEDLHDVNDALEARNKELTKTLQSAREHVLSLSATLADVPR